MTTMNLEHWDIDSAANRDRITEWVREKKPAFIVGKPQSRTMGHIRFICGLYQLQVQEGRWFVHEQPANAAAWKMKEVVCLKEAEGGFDSDFGPGNQSLNVIVERASDVRAKMNKRLRKPKSGNSIQDYNQFKMFGG